jgi:NADPH:quinone reductase-like Zn-dependent oxidoreductase
MDSETIDQLFKSLLHTEVTKTVHRDVYPAISPSRPELNQAGRVVLVTGGGTGVGHSVARAFVRAAADTVIIIVSLQLLAVLSSLLALLGCKCPKQCQTLKN